MKDDFDRLFDLQTIPTERSQEDRTEVPTMEMPLFRPGLPVTYQGQRCTVSHVMLTRSQLFVHLYEIAGAVKAEEIHAEKTRLVLARSR
ncbi:MAG: hypothetical protein A2Z93_03325 [Curvibacter sp. GWA2_64_110]|nr:MAG: hypothetical protein A2Z93_03325 [Curvibacter sp. GWA2_64_110]HCY14686.1 hypothetical protein [Curvibacter sp.]